MGDTFQLCMGMSMAHTAARRGCSPSHSTSPGRVRGRVGVRVRVRGRGRVRVRVRVPLDLAFEDVIAGVVSIAMASIAILCYT